MDFHRDICEQFAQAGQLKLTRLKLDNRILSVLYNVVIGDREYNLQLGFDQFFDRAKVSLGLLHLGYAIEHAIGASVSQLDLLAGSGKKTHFKEKLAPCSRQLSCKHAIRPKWREIMYRLFSKSTQDRKIDRLPAAREVLT